MKNRFLKSLTILTGGYTLIALIISAHQGSWTLLLEGLTYGLAGFVCFIGVILFAAQGAGQMFDELTNAGKNEINIHVTIPPKE